MAGTDHFEIEIKSLLGDEQAAHDFRNKLMVECPGVMVTARESQLNHYFEGGNLGDLASKIAPYLSEDDQEKLARIAARASSASVRTRDADGDVRFVVKASVGDDSSENGVARVELDASIEGMTLEELDQLILSTGYQYQAKWSRRRESYDIPGMSVCLDRNAGYGYVAEFEKVIHDESEVGAARAEIEDLMGRLGLSELPQDRLERMFAHYNAHWPEYYGTDKVFTIE